MTAGSESEESGSEFSDEEGSGQSSSGEEEQEDIEDKGLFFSFYMCILFFCWPFKPFQPIIKSSIVSFF